MNTASLFHRTTSRRSDTGEGYETFQCAVFWPLMTLLDVDDNSEAGDALIDDAANVKAPPLQRIQSYKSEGSRVLGESSSYRNLPTQSTHNPWQALSDTAETPAPSTRPEPNITEKDPANHARRSQVHSTHASPLLPLSGVAPPPASETYTFWERWNGEHLSNKVGWRESVKTVFAFRKWPWPVYLVLLTPVAWTFHFLNLQQQWAHQTTFALCFLSLIPLEIIFGWGGEQLALYLGTGLGDLVIVTLNNAIEGTLAILLLVKCELRLLQSTIIGVVLLHLLLVPGFAFFVGGIKIREQTLEQDPTDLNHSLLIVGMYAIMIPTAYFRSLDESSQLVSVTVPDSVLSDDMRGALLRISRGLAFILIIVYVGSRIYIHLPPSDDTASDALLKLGGSERSFPRLHATRTNTRSSEDTVHHRTANRGRLPSMASSASRGDAPSRVRTTSRATKPESSQLNQSAPSQAQGPGQASPLPAPTPQIPAPVVKQSRKNNTGARATPGRNTEQKPPPRINSWVATILLISTVALMAITSEFLVQSIEHVRAPKGIPQEFFGLILLPLVSFSAGGISAVLYFLRSLYIALTRRERGRPSRLAKARPIDLSIQFILLWMPCLVLLGWIIKRPMILMFDNFEVVLLISSSYLVNNVTVHAKTNWAKGLIMICSYAMIGTTVWFYSGQSEQQFLLSCPGSVAAAIENEDTTGTMMAEVIA
ncbi:hypothetical protein NM688_g6245 [Phlebia brevispora]|uniref:Uncharacterized protein n=1 Tax=Phlebia brevispora TaxID=194682 RepID=A0ACC1SIA2_9APHY|nr:hypothetical protein NM688_g6245 [Phlebia brevispora]